MDTFVIKGKSRLSGRVRVSNSKNATLPIMAAALLTPEPCIIENIPKTGDIETMVDMLKALDVQVEYLRDGKDLRIDASNELRVEAPYEIVKKMRASYYVLGPLLARQHRAKVSLPGGCAIGPRPIDLHLKGMELLGANIKIEHGYIVGDVRKLVGNEIRLDGPKGPSVGATCNVMMAAVLAQGETVIIGAALEPEVVDLANFLNHIGAKIEGAGSSIIKIKGVKALNGGRYEPIPDRIEAGTFAIGAAITKGDVEIENCRASHLDALLTELKNVGCEIEISSDKIRVSLAKRPKPTNITTAPYPGFPTDFQAQFMALLSIAKGTSLVTENIFESRFLHTQELNRMGAKISLDGQVATVEGVKTLQAAPVMCSDLRAGASLVLAGLAASGTTEVSRIYHLDRGYERFEKKLNELGAKIERVRQ